MLVVLAGTVGASGSAVAQITVPAPDDDGPCGQIADAVPFVDKFDVCLAGVPPSNAGSGPGPGILGTTKDIVKSLL
ncbi:hypothetical protein BRC83_02100 [Halobacteriales archaeon QS_1_68_17]|nr:MAG: hypothetical protein BRC83_02100 [Halobacteriales archaeon QS_1_68_17]